MDLTKVTLCECYELKKCKDQIAVLSNGKIKEITTENQYERKREEKRRGFYI